jgi:hypothetical protein
MRGRGAEALIETFVNQAARWAGRINTSFAAAAVTPEDLEVVGSLTAERIVRSHKEERQK